MLYRKSNTMYTVIHDISLKLLFCLLLFIYFIILRQRVSSIFFKLSQLITFYSIQNIIKRIGFTVQLIIQNGTGETVQLQTHFNYLCAYM